MSNFNFRNNPATVTETTVLIGEGVDAMERLMAPPRSNTGRVVSTAVVTYATFKALDAVTAFAAGKSAAWKEKRASAKAEAKATKAEAKKE